MAKYPSFPAAKAPELELTQLKNWENANLDEQIAAAREDAPMFTFYEGPPTANGKPGIHHVLGRTLKDVICRYKSMQGFRIDRKAGWDTHGLPVEIAVEKALGLDSREAIEEYGIDKYNAACREHILKNKPHWDALTKRIGYSVDLENPYITFDNRYIESVWWLLKQIHEKGLLFEGDKIQWYSPGSGTVLSSHEVSLGYKTVQDPSVYAFFPLLDDTDTALVAWTTTPWTLPANVALAVGPKIDYVKVKVEGLSYQYLILAKSCLGSIKEDHEIVETYKGEALVGKTYEPLFGELAKADVNAKAHRVVTADYISTSDGTGIVHTAPAFGADDHLTALKHDLPLWNPVKPDGTFEDIIDLVKGVWFKDADKPILKHLKALGKIYRAETVEHNYPLDWRKDTPLMQYPVKSWFVKTTAVKEQLIAGNHEINWHPEAVGKGRFGDWLENNIDWALSRKRYWGTPLPIWKSDAEGSEYIEVIGSFAELKEKCPQITGELDDVDLHRPFVDDLTWPAPDGGTMRRFPEVIDVWFDSGAMPFAQWHYPFENKEAFERNFPADFIAEGLDQTRGWFYTLHAIATCVMGKPAYKNVIVNGLVLDETGEKMSKSKGNTVDPELLLNEQGADALRWYMLSQSQPWDNTKFATKAVGEVQRKLFSTIKNVYSFFATYANIDGFDPKETTDKPTFTELDAWIQSRTATLCKTVADAFESYNPTVAARLIEQYVDELSNWYVRRSRARFWTGKKAGHLTGDAVAAYQTLSECLKTLSGLMAPIAPFFADSLFGLVTGSDVSVHLSDYPKADKDKIDPALEAKMQLGQKIVKEALALRNDAKLPVRQPLAALKVALDKPDLQPVLEALRPIILDELNIESLDILQEAEQLVSRALTPNFRVLGKRVGPKMKQVQAALKQVDSAAIAAFLQSNTLTLQVDGESMTFDESEIGVKSTPNGDYQVGQTEGVTIALETTLTPDLIAKGHAREVINRVQNLRKQQGFDVADRIILKLSASAVLQQSIEAHQQMIAQEVLAISVDVLQLDSAEVFEFGGETLHVLIEKAA